MQWNSNILVWWFIFLITWYFLINNNSPEEEFSKNIEAEYNKLKLDCYKNILDNPNYKISLYNDMRCDEVRKWLGEERYSTCLENVEFELQTSLDSCLVSADKYKEEARSSWEASFY